MRINIGKQLGNWMLETNFKSFLLCKYKSLESLILNVHRLNLPSYLIHVPVEMHCEKPGDSESKCEK